ncbi:MAG: histidine triad nucleotide-binding protein [Dehalococcoidia bacterium]
MPYDPENVFAKIIRGEIPSARVHEDEEFVAIRDIAPAAPTHILVLPRREGVSAPADLEDGDADWVGRMVLLGTRLARAEGLEAGGYRLLMNCGPDAGQTVPHLHLHILGGRRLGELA